MEHYILTILKNVTFILTALIIQNRVDIKY
jgi:hypothetical protein